VPSIGNDLPAKYWRRVVDPYWVRHMINHHMGYTTLAKTKEGLQSETDNKKWGFIHGEGVIAGVKNDDG